MELAVERMGSLMGSAVVTKMSSPGSEEVPSAWSKRYYNYFLGHLGAETGARKLALQQRMD